MTSSVDILSSLRAIVGAEQVRTAIEELTFFSTDISKQGMLAEAIVTVATQAELSDVVRTCTEAGRIVLPRGGGFSYTGGYLPVAENTVIVDMRGMNRVLDINVEDMYVEVEVGCTWERLYQALKEKGVRTPYFGPMSGYQATVGGALSQGSLFLGSSQYGLVAESVLALELVLADGSVVKTGSWASTNGCGPFLRNYGPDLTGLFLSDTGAFGFKTKAVIKLIPFPAYQQYGTFAFDNEAEAIKAMSKIGRAGLAAECYCWDPYFVKVMASKSTGLAQDLKFLSGVATGGGSALKGLVNAAKVAMAGKRALAGDVFLLNVVCDDLSEAGAAARLKAVREIATGHEGREITASAPMALRGTPFTNFNVPALRDKVRNLPVNSLSPHSKIGKVSLDVRAWLADNAELMTQHGIQCGVIYFAVGAQAMCCEPLLYWEDLEHYQHNRIDQRSDMAELAKYNDRPAPTKVALALREELKALFERNGCCHVQIGKSYPYLRTRQPATAELLAQIKGVLDPKGLVNRGSLGLAPAAIKI